MEKNEMLSLESRQNLDNLMIEYPELITYVSVSSHRISPDWLSTSVSIHSTKPIDEIKSILNSIPGLSDMKYKFDYESNGEELQSFECTLDGCDVTVVAIKEKAPAVTQEPTVKNSTSDFTINDLSVEEYLKREG